MIARSIFTVCAVFMLAALIGCPRPIGRCRYSADTERHGEVTILAVAKMLDGSREMMKVSVDGFFRHDFYITPDNFGKCLASKGYGVGSKVKGTISPGGPCPPCTA